MQVRDELRVLVEAEVERAIENFKKLGVDIEKTERKTESLGKALGSLAEVVVLTKSLSVIKDMGAFALQTADSFQTARNQFGILLGDMEAGAGLFNEIKAFNDKTPFDLNTLTQATNALIAAKVPLQDLQGQLAKFGDLSQGNSQKMTSYVNAFSQAAAKGKADMQVMNTYLHQGVPILDELAKNFGVATAEIVEMSSQGKIGFADFSAALDSLTAAGGRYFGGMELASQSLAAMQEGLKEAVNSLAASFGEMLLPAAIGTVGIFTDLANAINDNPIVKGILAGALVAAAGYMTAMAVKAIVLTAKTWLAYAAQMGLNTALAATNPLLLAGIAAAAAATAGFVAYAATQQKAATEAENFAYQQRKQNDAVKEGLAALQAYHRDSQNFSLEAVRNEMDNVKAALKEIDDSVAEHNSQNPLDTISVIDRDLEGRLRSLAERLKTLRDDFIKKYYDMSGEEKIIELRNTIGLAQKFLVDVDISPADKQRLESIIAKARDEIASLSGDIEKKAAEWKKSWADFMAKSQADQSIDPFASIEYERKKKLEDAYNNHIREANKETVDQINDYYNRQRSDAIEKLGREEDRIRRELSASKIDGLRYEMREALDAINKLETQRVIAAANSAEEIAAIRERFARMREDAEYQFKIKIEKTELEEARDAVKDFQQELSDSLTLALLNIKDFSSAAAVAIGDLAAQFAVLSASATLSGFEEFGRALGEGKNAAESLQAALADMCRQILQQLPMMFLQAGLQLIASGQWALGLGFIAAAGSSAIVSGYVSGKSGAAQENAQGGVYGEYGRAARAFAAGGAFTNQIVSAPTYFRHGGGLGLMGEAGPEAIMPLKRMANGDLGVQTGNGGNTQVTVNIINNSGAEARQEETTDANGNKQIDIIIGDLVNRHIASGKADRVIGGRYNLRAAGV